MNKSEEALKKAKEAWKEIVEWWKKLWKWSIKVVWWTAEALWYTLESGWEIAAAWVSKIRENNKKITQTERKKRTNTTKKLVQRSWKSIKKAWLSWKKVFSWAWDMLSWAAKVVYNSGRWAYNLVNKVDNDIWNKITEKRREKWENKVSKVRNFFRNNILKLLIAWSILWYWWVEASQHFQDRNRDRIENVQQSEQEKIIRELFSSEDILHHLSWSGRAFEKKRESRYLWEDDAWNNMGKGFWFAERKKVIDGMCRMIESWHLEMVMKKADEAWVPRQCVYLALAESWWQAWANSWVAGGYRQFTKPSAQAFWLVDAQWNDYRSDPELSTDAAMRHLKENYKIVSNYNTKFWYNMSESDKRIFAFHMYNWSPKLVKQWLKACKWNANEYPAKQTNRENRNYVPRILWIEKALNKIFDECWYDVNKIKAIHLGQKLENTAADTMFEDYSKQKDSLSKKESITLLNKVKDKYKEEYDSKIISKRYYEWAISIIEEEIASFE